MIFLRTRKAELALIVLSLAVHLTCFAALVNTNNGSILNTVRVDDGYFELAQNVLAGHGFSWSPSEPYAPNPLRTPGYVYVLAGLLGVFGVGGAAFIQLIAASLIPVFGMWIAHILTHSPRIGMAVGVMLAIDPTLALLSFQFYTETFFLLLFLLWLLLTMHYLERRNASTLALSAILLGCTILVKTSVQYVPLLFIPFILWQFGRMEWRRGIAHVGMYLCIIGAILTPWILRNVQVFGVPGLSAQASFVLYTNLAPAVLSVAKGSDFLDERQAFLTQAEYKGDTITLVNGPTYMARALEVVRAYPLSTFFVTSKSLFTFFTNDGVYTLLAMTGHKPADFLWLLIPARLVWVGITIAAFVGAFVYLLMQRSPRAILIVLLVAYFALTSTIAAFGTNPRYRLPVDPILLSLAVIGSSYLLEQIRRWRGIKGNASIRP